MSSTNLFDVIVESNNSGLMDNQEESNKEVYQVKPFQGELTLDEPVKETIVSLEKS
jgi:hypothetical protein